MLSHNKCDCAIVTCWLINARVTVHPPPPFSPQPSPPSFFQCWFFCRSVWIHYLQLANISLSHSHFLEHMKLVVLAWLLALRMHLQNYTIHMLIRPLVLNLLLQWGLCYFFLCSYGLAFAFGMTMHYSCFQKSWPCEIFKKLWHNTLSSCILFNSWSNCMILFLNVNFQSIWRCP